MPFSSLARCVGMKFLEDCPIQPLIPLYLLVSGIIGTLKVKYLLFVVLCISLWNASLNCLLLMGEPELPLKVTVVKATELHEIMRAGWKAIDFSR